MQISPIQQNNTSFGMALYMPKPSAYSKILKPKTAVETEIFKKLVSYGEELEKSRPQLELLAKDVDVHITRFPNEGMELSNSYSFFNSGKLS